MSIQDKINFHDTRSVDAIHYNIPIQDIKLDQDKRVDTVRSADQDRSIDFYNQNRSVDTVRSADQNRSVDTVRSADQNRSVDFYNQNRSVDFYNQNRSIDFYNQNRSVDTVRSADQNRSVDTVRSADQNRSVDTVRSADQNRSVDTVRSADQDKRVFNTDQDIIELQEPQTLEIKPPNREPNPEIVKNVNREHNFKTHEYPSIYSIFHSILAFFAIYLSFKCNGGFSFGGFFMAIFFPYIYIIYKYATSEKFCGIFK